MKLSTLFSTFAQHQKGAELSGKLRSGAMSGPIERSRADALPQGGEAAQGRDQLNLSREAAFAMAASQFDPRDMSERDAHHLADLLFNHDAISPREYEILSNGPGRRSGGFGTPARRDFLSAWQERLAGGMGRSNFNEVNSSSRALSILGRVEAARSGHV